MSAAVDSIIGEIEKLNVLELVELTKTLQEKWGVSAAPVAAAAAPVAAAEATAAAPVEEQTEFDAILSEVGAEKIKVIKVVRELTGLGLKEAKEVVDNAPKPVKEGVSKEEAQKIAEKLAEVGAKVTIK
ncbi:MAG TPA: 50S ribosomal protein L7/L12 [Ktedonobacteraceae bacterium]|nr:50S ribosomal protein L7/L12 [Ktedonobacteraceae bacterium]